MINRALELQLHQNIRIPQLPNKKKKEKKENLRFNKIERFATAFCGELFPRKIFTVTVLHCTFLNEHRAKMFLLMWKIVHSTIHVQVKGKAPSFSNHMETDLTS